MTKFCLLSDQPAPRASALARLAVWSGFAVCCALALQACTKKADAVAAPQVKHSSMTDVGNGINRITLSSEAVQRLRLEFATPAKSGEQLMLPYKALLYDVNGKEWAYVSESPTTFKRMALKVSTVEGDTVLYTEGPQPQQQVVTWGAAMLFGIEFGIGK